jgi:hypothetical protein
MRKIQVEDLFLPRLPSKKKVAHNFTKGNGNKKTLEIA